MLDKAYLCFGMARDFVYRVWNMLSNNVIEPFVRTAKKEAQQLLTFIGTLASRVAADIVSSARQVWRSILAPSLCRIMPWCDTLCKMVITALSPFFKKYWQLISAGLAFNGSYHYFFAAILSDFSIIDRAKYLLGAWTLAVIGYIVARSVLLSSGTLVSQRLTVEDSALKFMDLRICHALFRICSSGWHLICKSLELSFCDPKDLLGSLVDLGYIISGDSQAIIDLTVPYRKEHMGFTIHVNSRSSWCPFHWLLCP
jgi:hypothetical protein